MKIVKWFPLIIALCMAAPVSGEIYKWADKNGVIHYSNTLSEVPEEYRDSVSVHGEIPSTPLPAESKDPWPESITAPKQEQPAVSSDEEAIDKPAPLSAEKEQALIEEKIKLMEDKEVYLQRYKTRQRKSVIRARIREIDERLREIDQELGLQGSVQQIDSQGNVRPIDSP